MKLIDQTSKTERGHSRLEAIIGSGRAGLIPPADLDAQQSIIAFLQKVLDNRYYLLRNINLEGSDILVPLILVGPTGVRVIVASGLRGIYRVKDDLWEELDERTQNYKPVQPNLVTRTQLMGQAVETFFSSHEKNVQGFEALLIFSDPGVHIDTTHPVARVILMDGLERLITEFLQARQLLSTEQVQEIASLLSGIADVAAPVQSIATEPDAFSFSDERQKPRRVLIKPPDDARALRAIQKVPFSSRQWVVLIGLILVDICLLVALVFVLLNLM